MAQPDIINLWHDDSENNGIGDGTRPRLEIYRPEQARSRPCPAVIVCPGGGYRVLADHEAEPFAELFVKHGYVAAILRYRLMPNRFPAPMADACRAVRLLRSLADRYDIDSERVAMIGFSAGGHLTASVATQPDLYQDAEDDLVGRYSARPNRAILAYAVVTLSEKLDRGAVEDMIEPGHPAEMKQFLNNVPHVTAETPPAFLFHTADDDVVPVSNSINYCQACLDHGVPAELHVFAHGHHGVGLATDHPDLAMWPDLVISWLEDWA